MGGAIIVFITADSKKTSKAITKTILKNRLVACVNEIPGIKSQYWWKGKLEKADEILLMAKTKKSRMKEIIEEVKKIHPYEVPEIISIDIKDGNKDYLRWIEAETK